MLLGATTIVTNNPVNVTSCCKSPSNPVLTYYRTRNCDTNLTCGSPAAQYQRQKIIQNTVRVPASLYTMNLGSLSSFESARSNPDKVCWNQMSDRKDPHVQTVVTSSGSAYGGNSRKRSLMRMRPGAMSPGGKGVDIKHNSYERRLNRLKGENVLRRGVIPPTFGKPIVFNRAYPVYGGKTVLTNIIEDCHCPIGSFDNNVKPSAFPNDIYSVKYQYIVGQSVYAKKIDADVSNTDYKKAVIISIPNDGYGYYTVQFTEDHSIVTRGPLEMIPYFDCACPTEHNIYDTDDPNPFLAINTILGYDSYSCAKNVLINTQIQTIINTIIA